MEKINEELDKSYEKFDLYTEILDYYNNIISLTGQTTLNKQLSS